MLLGVLEVWSALRGRDYVVNLQVGGGDVVLLDEGTLLVDDLVDTEVGVEVGLNVREQDRRAISSSSTIIQNLVNIVYIKTLELTRICLL